MKKLIVSCIAGVALMAMAALPIAACDGAKGTSASTETKASCGSTGTSAQMTSAHGSCASKTSGTSAQLTSAGGSCSASKTEGTSANLTAAEYAKMVGYEGKAELVNMSIKGMTCGGCETGVSTTLTACPGVVKVLSVNYKEGTALVLVDPDKAKTDALTTAVTNKGYQAEIIPAVATTTTASADGKTCTAAEKAACAKTCTAAEKAACAAKEAGAVKTSAAGSN
uniref:Heavy metal translocating P-type ATPase n=1 Tax=uncultured bacterium pAW1 TaxID=1781155 RepID=A0A1C9U4Q9_9BACT|nr:heavy metal translocating P-type ATPase [uncultured bacterium pAW1]